MIRLKSLHIEGFRRFTEPTVIDFPETGLMLIDGDSGAGKSTILQAIAYALDICPFPATTLRSWTGETLQVVLTIESAGRIIKIARGAKNYIQYDSEEPKTGVKAVKEELVKVFGMPPELLSALTYRPQDTLGMFLSKDDAEKKEFLAQVLGLTAIETALERADLRRKELSNRLTFAQGILTEREAGLRRVLEQVNEISPAPEETADLGLRVSAANEVVERLANELVGMEAVFTQNHSQFLAKCEAERQVKMSKIAQAEAILVKMQGDRESATRAYNKNRTELHTRLASAQKDLASVDAARKELAKLQTEVDALKKNTCYVCHQPFTAELAIDERTDKIEELGTLIASEPVLRQRVDDFRLAIENLTVPQPDPKEAKLVGVISTLESEIKWLGKSITDPGLIRLQNEIDAKKKTLYTAKSDLADAKLVLAQHRAAAEAKLASKKKAESVKDEAVKQVDTQRAEVAKIESQLHAELDFIGLLGREGFLGIIFDEVLAEIATHANTTLGQLANTSHVSVGFRAENAKGKRTIAPVFFVGEHETTRTSGLSGGMGASADLAVDLGVAAVVEARLGTAPGWLCLDESFNGMPKTTRESVLEILQQYSKDRLILVIDHATELKEFFPVRLQVKQENGRSIVC